MILISCDLYDAGKDLLGLSGSLHLLRVCLFIGLRLEFFVLDYEALVAASADLSFFIISSDLKYELASVDFH